MKNCSAHEEHDSYYKVKLTHKSGGTCEFQRTKRDPTHSQGIINLVKTIHEKYNNRTNTYVRGLHVSENKMQRKGTIFSQYHFIYS